MSVYVMAPDVAIGPPPTDPGLTWVGIGGQPVTGPAFDWDGTGTPPVQPLTGQAPMLASAAAQAGYTGVGPLIRDYNRAAIAGRARAALAANQSYLAIVSPNLAQATNQIGLLTRECNGLIRLALDLLDDIAGT